MTVQRHVVPKVENFDRPLTLTTTPQGEFGWTVADTSAVGAPVYAVKTNVDGGAMQLLLQATAEVQNVCMYQNDILLYDWELIQYVEFTVAAAVAFVSGDTLFFGLGNARNDAVASITEKFVFKVVAATSLVNVVIDTKDGTTEVANTATGKTMTSTPKRFGIDFSNGIADVRAYIDGDRVATGTTFNLSALTDGNNCQLMAQIQKTATTNVPDIRIHRVAIQYKVADGA